MIKISNVLFFLALIITFYGCSRRQFPTSSASNQPEIVSSQMQAFLNGGVEKPLDTNHKKPKKIIKTAVNYIGTPHCMGGTTEKCMDCSGLTYVSFARNGIILPRSSQEQARYGRIIYDRNELKKGDLLFFTLSYDSPSYITHVGIYVGNNKFLHASSSIGVTETLLSNPWWSQRFVFATRVF